MTNAEQPGDQQSWSAPPAGYRAAPPTNSYAITALVSSLVLAPLGIIFGHIALKQMKRSGEAGRGLAIGGLVIGYLGTVSAVIALVVILTAVSEVKSGLESDSARINSSISRTSSVVNAKPAGPLQMDYPGIESDSSHDAFSNSVYGQDCVAVPITAGGMPVRLPGCTVNSTYSTDNGYAVYKVTGRSNTRTKDDPLTFCDGGSYIADATVVLCLKPYSG